MWVGGGGSDGVLFLRAGWTWGKDKECEWRGRREEEREDRTRENEEEGGVWCEWSE